MSKLMEKIPAVVACLIFVGVLYLTTLPSKDTTTGVDNKTVFLVIDLEPANGVVQFDAAFSKADKAARYVGNNPSKKLTVVSMSVDSVQP